MSWAIYVLSGSIRASFSLLVPVMIGYHPERRAARPREEAVLSLQPNGRAAHQSMSVSSLSPASKWPVKSKPVLQEVSSMPLLIRSPLSLQPLFHPPLHLLSLSLLFLAALARLSPTLRGDMACAPSPEQRKPKTRGILLKGVSRQPDINNLCVCRAESKPLGICGYTWVYVCVCACPGI